MNVNRIFVNLYRPCTTTDSRRKFACLFNCENYTYNNVYILFDDCVSCGLKSNYQKDIFCITLKPRERHGVSKGSMMRKSFPPYGLAWISIAICSIYHRHQTSIELVCGITHIHTHEFNSTYYDYLSPKYIRGYDDFYKYQLWDIFV